MTEKLTLLYIVAQRFVAERRAELDEKALLMAVFVVASVAALPALATAVDGTFGSVTSTL